MSKKRPTISSIKTATESNAAESFQNTVVRPIIKMQHGLLLAFFRHYLSNRKVAFADFSEQRKVDFIGSTMKSDVAFRNELKGLVIGHFSVEEYGVYLTMQREVNRRIFGIVAQRLGDSLGEI